MNVDFIVLAGVTAEFGVAILVYINQTVNHYQTENRLLKISDLKKKYYGRCNITRTSIS